MMGQVNTRPGPATRLNLPKRSTTAFSHSNTMCTDEDASHPTMAALTRATRPISANAACAAASTMPNASTNTTTANTTAPLREARLRLVTERMPSGAPRPSEYAGMAPVENPVGPTPASAPARLSRFIVRSPFAFGRGL